MFVRVRAILCVFVSSFPQTLTQGITSKNITKMNTTQKNQIHEIQNTKEITMNSRSMRVRNFLGEEGVITLCGCINTDKKKNRVITLGLARARTHARMIFRIPLAVLCGDGVSLWMVGGLVGWSVGWCGFDGVGGCRCRRRHPTQKPQKNQVAGASNVQKSRPMAERNMGE